MLTPKFSISQDSAFLYIHIHVPHIKIADADCYVNDDEFYFYSQPYYLRLSLPGKVVENHTSTSQYDVDTGQLTIRLAKQEEGETFEGLDMLTKLLTPKRTAVENPGIEIVDSENHDKCQNSESIPEADEEGDDFDWFIEQKPAQSFSDKDPNFIAPKYGFANKYSETLNDLAIELTELIDLKDADNTSAAERKLLRRKQENEAFNCEHYLADFFEDEMIQDIITPNYPELIGTTGINTELSENESEKLMQLPRREYIMDERELQAAYLGLVDILYAYSYSFRFSKGELGVESDWTICKLSATLSWLDIFENLKDVVVSCARRTMCFPLYRNWKLFQRVFQDVKQTFKLGKSQILKCLLGIHKVISESDTRYPLNNLYIVDYCVWIQTADHKKIESISKALEKLDITKSDLELQLDEMEADALDLMNETDSDDEESKNVEHQNQNNVDFLAQKMSDIVKISESQVSDSDDETDDDDDGSSSTSGSDSDSQNSDDSEISDGNAGGT